MPPEKPTGAPYTSSSAFIGKVTTDTANTTDTTGTATYSTILDFLNFDNIFRGWGRSGGAFPNSNNMGRCTTGTCQIWDWSLSKSDTVSLNRSRNGSTINNGVNASTNGVLEEIDGDGVGNNDETCVSGDQCVQKYLSKATEIMGDGDGDDDTLCESGEDCVYNPNIGAYQGHGALVGPCTFQNGTITNVRMFGYEYNGR